MAEEPPWHGQPEFWEMFQSSIFSPDVVERAETQVEQLLELLGSEHPARVLDIPCGIGRHAIVLAERGWRVTAVDNTSVCLDSAQHRGQEVEPDIEFVQDDMREFVRPETYDLIINLYTSFGYFEQREEDEQTARNFYTSLTDGGRLVMELTSKEILARNFENRTWQETAGRYWLEERTIIDDWSWIENRWILVDEGELEEFTVSHRLYSGYELAQLLSRVGFQEVSLYGNTAGEPFDHEADRLVAVAKK